MLLANLVSLGDIAVTYRNDLEQLLVLFPQGTAVMSAIAVADSGVKQAYRGIYLDFNLNLNLAAAMQHLDSCRSGSSGRRRIRTIPSGPRASCIAVSRRTRT